MSVSVQEVAFLVLLTLFVVATARVTRGESRWLLGVPVCAGIAVFVTPADILSTLIVAVPYTIAYTYLAWKRAQEHVKQSK